MVADCSDVNVVLDADSTEGTSRGVALLVAMSLSEEREIIEERCFNGMTNVDSPYYLANSKEVPRPILSSKPRPDVTAMYSKRAESQENYIDCISPLFCSRPYLFIV